MDQRVQDWITEQKQKLIAKEEQERRDRLISLGLCDKVYALDGDADSDFPHVEYDPTTGNPKRYRLATWDVTDEEYTEILKLKGKTDVRENKPSAIKNGIAKAFKVLSGLVVVAGFAAGASANNGFEAVYGIAGFISGMTLFGFGEVIQLLTDIKYKE
ncbi:MAG: hypothetical protein IJT18_04345 [Oscillospiraceae bacterium]|nr:hypothetical protein [Oscillospiraceae bacterium]